MTNAEQFMEVYQIKLKHKHGKTKVDLFGNGYTIPTLNNAFRQHANFLEIVLSDYKTTYIILKGTLTIEDLISCEAVHEAMLKCPEYQEKYYKSKAGRKPKCSRHGNRNLRLEIRISEKTKYLIDRLAHFTPNNSKADAIIQAIEFYAKENKFGRNPFDPEEMGLN